MTHDAPCRAVKCTTGGADDEGMALTRIVAVGMAAAAWALGRRLRDVADTPDSAPVARPRPRSVVTDPVRITSTATTVATYPACPTSVALSAVTVAPQGFRRA